MTNRITSDGTPSEDSIESQGLDVVVAAATTETAVSDDVFIDGRIITAENYDAAAGQDGSDLLIVNNGDGSDFLEGGEGFDFVQVNGADAVGDSGGVGDRMDGGSGNDVLLGEEGRDPATEAGDDSFAFVEAEGESRSADSADPVLMVISNQDFWYQDHGDSGHGDVVPTEDFAMNYEEIKLDADTGFDDVFDAM